MKPSPHAKQAYIDAFTEIVSRISAALAIPEARNAPVNMYVAGGAAMYLYTGARVSEDIDAIFSRRIVLPMDLEVTYLDEQSAAHLLYFDYQYNDTVGLLHKDADDDSLSLTLSGIDPGVIDVRLLSPLDLAVSKIARFADHDRDDIATLARCNLIKSTAFRSRAEQALGAYVGEVSRVRTSIELACKIIYNEQSSSS